MSVVSLNVGSIIYPYFAMYKKLGLARLGSCLTPKIRSNFNKNIHKSVYYLSITLSIVVIDGVVCSNLCRSITKLSISTGSVMSPVHFTYVPVSIPGVCMNGFYYGPLIYTLHIHARFDLKISFKTFYICT